MCYTGGPRCSPEARAQVRRARARLWRAKDAYDTATDEDSDALREKVHAAQAALHRQIEMWGMSPDGLRASGEMPQRWVHPKRAKAAILAIEAARRRDRRKRHAAGWSGQPWKTASEKSEQWAHRERFPSSMSGSELHAAWQEHREDPALSVAIASRPRVRVDTLEAMIRNSSNVEVKSQARLAIQRKASHASRRKAAREARAELLSEIAVAPPPASRERETVAP